MPKAKKEKEPQEEHSDAGEEPKKKKKSKVKKDPNAPKRYVLGSDSISSRRADTWITRAMSAFMFYSMAQRDNVKNANPELSFGKTSS